MKHFFTTLSLMLCASLPAAAESSISVTPAVITLRGEPGQGTTQEISVANQTDQELAFEMVAYDVVLREGKRAFVPAGEIVGSIAATAVFSQPTIRVAPGETGTVSVTVTLARNAVHRAVVLVFSGKTLLRTDKATVRASIGTLMTFQVTDQIVVDASAPVVLAQTESENVRVLQRCANTGPEPAVLKGTAAVLDASGNLVGRVDLPSHRLLPGEEIEIAGELAEELPRGNYRVLVTLQTEAKTTTADATLEVP